MEYELRRANREAVSAIRDSERRRGRIFAIKLSEHRAHRPDKGLQFDEAIVFIDISDVQDEAALVHDIERSGRVALAKNQYHYQTWYSDLRISSANIWC